MPNPVKSSEIVIPDSELCQKATRLVAELSPKVLYHHCIRSYLFAEVLGQRDGLQYDRELLYLSTVMHDLGLTERFNGEQRFEVDGADAAGSFLMEHGLPEEKAEIVWDAIALHTSLGIASRKRPEIALTHLGIGMDVFGFRAEDIASETVERVIEAYPRLGCNHALVDLVVSQIKQKPQKALPYTWAAQMAKTHIPGFVCPSYEDMIRNSPFSD